MKVLLLTLPVEQEHEQLVDSKPMLLLPFFEVMMQVALLGGLEDYLAVFIYLEARRVNRSQFLARSKMVHEPWLLLE